MPNPEPIDAVDERDRDRNVLNLMLNDSPWPWSLGEIARELRSELAARDAVTRLVDAGLLHRLDGGFVFPTRAARRADELGLGGA
ncbi:MAG TPA: hypothetical protein VFW38_01885 [Solirubrobacteraceae bacterium]|nr:hypothetical protein [Solirubrobacteraceae bacterium]